MSLIAPQSRRSAAETAAGGTQFWPRVPPNFFGIPFGLAGLAEAWYAASPTLGTSAVVPDAIDIVAAVAWLADWPVDRRRRGPGEVSPRVLPAHGGGRSAYAIVIIAAITLFIGVIAFRTMIMLLRGQLLVRPSPPADSTR